MGVVRDSRKFSGIQGTRIYLFLVVAKSLYFLFIIIVVVSIVVDVVIALVHVIIIINNIRN